MDRDFLTQGAEYLQVSRDARQVPRIFLLLESVTMRKIFSTILYALIATIQKED